MISALFRPSRTEKRPPTPPLSLLALAATLAAAPPTTSAQDAPELPRDIVSLSAEAETDVDHDLMRAVLVVQAEAEEPDALADQINRTMRWALDALEPFPDVERETRDYRTWPRRDSSRTSRLIGWGGSQSLELESEDFAQMGKAIQTLQERLQVQGTQLGVSGAARREASDTLIDEALDAFERRAARIGENLGATGYRILEVDVRVDSSGHEPPMMTRSVSRSAESDVAEPGIAGGSSRLTATASGRIQLERDDDEGEGER